MRLLEKNSRVLTIRELGLDAPRAALLSRLVDKPHGLFLATGPTGSGKTTTLYSILQSIYTPEKKILTIEDPVEYELAGVAQIPVRPSRNFTFANGLRSILRQDPDVVMVGEIRDSETAEIAIRAALTGPPGFQHAAHQRLHRRGHAADGHGRGAVPDFVLARRRAGATAGPAHLHPLPGGRPRWNPRSVSRLAAIRGTEDRRPVFPRPGLRRMPRHRLPGPDRHF